MAVHLALCGLLAMLFFVSATTYYVAVTLLLRDLPRPRRPRGGAGEERMGQPAGARPHGVVACTLRQTTSPWPRQSRRPTTEREGDTYRRWAQEAALAALCSLPLLLPWMVLADRSRGTPCYPLILGNRNKDFNSFEPITVVGVAGRG